MVAVRSSPRLAKIYAKDQVSAPVTPTKSRKPPSTVQSSYTLRSAQNAPAASSKRDKPLRVAPPPKSSPAASPLRTPPPRKVKSAALRERRAAAAGRAARKARTSPKAVEKDTRGKAVSMGSKQNRDLLPSLSITRIAAFKSQASRQARPIPVKPKALHRGETVVDSTPAQADPDASVAWTDVSSTSADAMTDMVPPSSELNDHSMAPAAPMPLPQAVYDSAWHLSLLSVQGYNAALHPTFAAADPSFGPITPSVWAFPAQITNGPVFNPFAGLDAQMPGFSAEDVSAEVMAMITEAEENAAADDTPISLEELGSLLDNVPIDEKAIDAFISDLQRADMEMWIHQPDMSCW